MKLYCIRHGESINNAKKLHQGENTPLSEIGESQAKLLAHRFKTIPIDLIIASPYRRTRQTAQAIADLTGHDIEIEPLIHEIKNPDIIIDKPYHSQESQDFRQAAKENINNPNWHYADEENYHDLIERVRQFLYQVIQRPENFLAVVTHGHVLRTLTALILHGPRLTVDTLTSTFHTLATSNTGITLLEYNPKREDPSWQIVTWNDHAHLG